jgi:acyl carrier protein
MGGAMDDVRVAVRDYILEEFLPGETPDALTDTTPLVTGGILDSLASLKLVAFLEEQYGIEVQAYETNVDNLDTITDIEALVRSKLSE